jgi:hypothetical protein
VAGWGTHRLGVGVRSGGVEGGHWAYPPVRHGPLLMRLSQHDIPLPQVENDHWTWAWKPRRGAEESGDLGSLQACTWWPSR